MSITVKDLFQYDANFDQKKIQYLTGKKEFKKNDTVALSRLAAMNDKDLSVFAAQKEGKSFVNLIKDDNLQTQVADASGINVDNKNKNNNVHDVSAMDKSIFDIGKQKKHI